MSLLVIKQGLLDTVQDLGLYGHQHSGINPGGAMDPLAMQVANVLVGNRREEAVLEMHFPAPVIEFETDCVIAITGADFGALIGSSPVATMRPLPVNKGSVLRFTKQTAGARMYLSVRGGMVTDNWLGSNSTHLITAKGGFAGRALKKADRISLKENNQVPDFKNSKITWSANISAYYDSSSIRFVPGNEYHLLNDASKAILSKQSFAITPQSDRMGYRLNADPLQLKEKTELISTAVTKGTIQLLPDGQLIILMADHQTTGGYPRIGHVISADIPSLAQKNAGDSFLLEQTDIRSAHQLFFKQQSDLQQLENACNFRLEQIFNQT